METIFDHNPTDEELKRFGGKESFEWLDKKGLPYFTCEDDANYHLGILFSMRKDFKKAEEYFSKIENKRMLDLLIQDF